MPFVPLRVETGAGFDTLTVETAAGVFVTLLVEAGFGDEGLYVAIDGVDVSRWVQRDWKIARKAGARSDADFDLVAPVTALTLPRPGSLVEARNGGAGGSLIFAGLADEPKNVLLVGSKFYDLTVRSLGWRTRLDDVQLTQAQGIAIVKLATAADQVAALVAVLASEGFTSDVSIPNPDVPDRQDMRFLAIGKVLNRLAELNDASVVVSALKVLSFLSRSMLAASFDLDGSVVAEISHDVSQQNYRTSQTIRGGEIGPIRQNFSGRVDGAYRIGGLQNLTPTSSLFDAPTGHGVSWRDVDRDRGGRGAANRAVLLQTSDGAAALPSDLVTGPDRTIDLIQLTEIGLTIDGVTFPAGVLAKLGVLFRASDGSEFAWLIAGASSSAPPYTPDAPTGRHVITGRAINWAWNAPDSNNSPITGYRLRTRLWGSSVAHSHQLGNVTVYRQRSLEYDTYLQAQVRAINAIGSSQYSEWSEAVYVPPRYGTYYIAPPPTAPTLPSVVAPYFVHLTDLGFSLLEVRSAITSLRDGQSTAVIVDTTQPRIDFPNRLIRASETIIEVEATNIVTVDVDSTNVDIGGENDDWSWNPAAQEVVQNPPANPPPTMVETEYKGRWIKRETSGKAPHVERVSIRSDLGHPDDGAIAARAELAIHGTQAEIIDCVLVAGAGLDVEEGQGCTLSQALLDSIETIVAATPDTIWRVDRVDIEAQDGGELLVYSLKLLRYQDESRYVQEWLVAFDRTE